ncbi:MAG: bifunctional UDP-N-acetylglucosamine diphosphorylase/glucosamine-1-phosphate N-acetyltransferase GlmU, partial [Proteobacteria bacterium]|nr:bifunctional UDP-N-acetylglucosamine diphosphorylase/glucosamine-1-phosphate N-acetyltransferase GlmU [Pseudomonadota bacterium]
NEYYLTDCFQLARTQGLAVDVWITDNYRAFDGVNDRRQLAQSEQYILQQIRDKWMLNGVSFVLPETCYIEDSVEIGPDTQIGPHCSLIGKTRIGRFCEIGSHVHLKDVMIADSTQIAAGTIKA